MAETRIYFLSFQIQTNMFQPTTKQNKKHNKQAEMLVSTIHFHVHVNNINKFISEQDVG